MTQPHNKRKVDPKQLAWERKLDLEHKAGRIDTQEAVTLTMVSHLALAKPDGRFAELLVALLQGDV